MDGSLQLTVVVSLYKCGLQKALSFSGSRLFISEGMDGIRIRGAQRVVADSHQGDPGQTCNVDESSLRLTTYK